MSWWWPFKKKQAEQAELDFRESLSQALLRQDDLEAATQRLRESRTQPRRAPEGEPVADIPRSRVRNA